jgi:proteasome lid subunit RPN8/RPN11
LDIDLLLMPQQKQQIRFIALAEYEKNKAECCGLLLEDGDIYPCENQSESPSQAFVIETKLYVSLEKEKGIVAVFHSHTNGNPNFSAADVDLVNRTQKPLILYDVTRNEFSAIDPSGKTPLIGRSFCYGVYDCYSLVRDYYQQEKGVEIPNYPRSSDEPVWDKAAWDWIDREWGKIGCEVKLSEIQIGDVIAMSIGSNAPGINHLAVYMGDDKFIHQLSGRKSNIEVWGSPWSEYTIKFLRYKDVDNCG